jgi:hypothetical protein
MSFRVRLGRSRQILKEEKNENNGLDGVGTFHLVWKLLPKFRHIPGKTKI